MVATLASMIDLFNRDNLRILKELNCEVSVMANFQFGNGTSIERVKKLYNELLEMGIKIYDINIDRKPLSKANLVAYKQMKEIMNHEKFDLIHCQSPQAGALVRLASISVRKTGTKVIYVAHGFHFLKGATFKTWMVYFPLEWWLSNFCDLIITINSEDEAIARKWFRVKRVARISGAGINLEKFTPTNAMLRYARRKEVGYLENDFIILCVGELVSNKHQDFLIRLIHSIGEKIPNIRLLLAGQGQETMTFKELSKSLGVQSKVEFLGFRNDVVQLMQMADVAVSSSKREGLPINIMEAMATGIPVVATNCRGNRDLVCDEKNGFLIEQEALDQFADRIEQLYRNPSLRVAMGEEGKKSVIAFSSEIVNGEMRKIYEEYL